MTHAREIGNPGKNAIAPMPRTALGTLALIAAFGQPLAAEPNSAPRIAWHGNLADGLAEARRSGRPILLVSGAPACLGIPGVW